MTEFGIALDLGTSGFRVQAVDLEKCKVVSTVVTEHHPLPGINIMDHLHFAVEAGRDVAHSMVITAVNRMLKLLDIDLNRVVRIAVCGNPCQLSIFQNIEIRDLAWSGKHKLEREGIIPPKRDATIVEAWKLGLTVKSSAEVLIPPAIKHEVGADALAMMIRGGFLEDREIALATDYGTNAEMALKVGDTIYTGSASAGSAIEGQHIEKGMLASCGAVSDVSGEDGGWRCYILDDKLISQPGDIVDPKSGTLLKKGPMHGKARGITGTGVVAILTEGMVSGIVTPPRINTPDRKVHLQDGLYLTEEDLIEVGKAIGAVRAGHITLAEEAGISLQEITTMYMAGASGFYIDALKAQRAGMVPGCVNRIYQMGNTSLAMARDLVTTPELIDRLQRIVDELRATHVTFSVSRTFERVYLLELAYWMQGMPLNVYDSWLRRYGLKTSLQKSMHRKTEVRKLYERDVGFIGKKGLRVIEDVGLEIVSEIDGCNGCKRCEVECFGGALRVISMDNTWGVSINTAFCSGISCQRCQKACPEGVLDFKQILGRAVFRGRSRCSFH
jgi:methylamine methyltransferase corrinoid protein reductive activase